MFCQRGSEFFLLALCVYVGGGGGGGRGGEGQIKNPIPLLLINDWSL